ncbi:hypothetical protein [Mucilaginibacter sp.]|uniref:hypothetical protein n=1 Tax=Mucilaginibacter sp. TaxID=1882438 RepID=UPI0035BBA3F9
MEPKKIGKGKADATHHNANNIVEVMKPFVGFGIKAIAVLGSALVHIVKNIPKPADEKQPVKSNRVIKI